MKKKKITFEELSLIDDLKEGAASPAPSPAQKLREELLDKYAPDISMKFDEFPVGITTLTEQTEVLFYGDDCRYINPGTVIRMSEGSKFSAISANGWQLYHVHDGLVIQVDVDEGDMFVNAVMPEKEGKSEITYRPNHNGPGAINVQFEYDGKMPDHPAHHHAFRGLFDGFFIKPCPLCG